MAAKDAREEALRSALARVRQDTVAASKRIAELASSRGWTEKELATAAGYKSVSTFNNWKMGHEIPKPQNLLPFAVSVGLTVRLLTYDAAELIAGGNVSEEAVELAKKIEKLGEAERIYLKGIIDGLGGIGSRPSMPAAQEKGQRGRHS